MKRIHKTISIIIVLAMLFTILPAQTFAAPGKRAAIPEPVINTPNPDRISSGNILGEMADKREKNIKQFFTDKHTYVAAVYPTAVHYLDNGKWKDIDNTLISSKDAAGNDILQNKDNSYKIAIAKSSKSNKLVSIQKDQYEVSWNFQNVNATASSIKAADTKQLNKLSANEKKTVLPKLSNSVDFAGIYPNINLQYDIQPEKVEESIILNQKMDNPQFNLNLYTKNLVPTMTKDKTIIFYDDKDTKKEVFRMYPPYMIDAKGEISKDIEISLAPTQSGYLLTIKPDNAWLNDAARTYPVKIDPIIETSTNPADIKDVHVASAYPNDNYQFSDRLRVGRGPTTGVNRAYISFTLPTLTTADMVIEAYLNMDLMTANANAYQVDVHKVTGSWDPSTINWANKPAFDPGIKDYQMVQSVQKYYWDITPIAKEWYNTGNNFGIMLKSHDETPTAYSEFYSSDVSAVYAQNRPLVTLKYVNYSGLESYWTYHSQDVGRAGTGYVNDYNGNLIYIHNDVNMNGNRMPLTLNHVFNSNERTNAIGYGDGWRLNLSQTILRQTIGTEPYYVYTDEDGTKHYFDAYSSDGPYKDESGLDLTLTVNADGSYELKDKKDNKLNFMKQDTTEVRYLKTVVDSNSNTMTLGYEGNVLKTVTDGAGRVTTLNYAAGKLTSVVDPSNRTTTYSYTGNKLTKITYPDAKYAGYAYDANGNMSSATNIDGYKVTFAYQNVSPYRMKKVQETHTDGTLGQELNMTYGNNITIFSDYSGRKNVYQFNDYGNTVNIKDADGNSEYYRYDKDSNINKLALDSRLQRTITNYLVNHDVEVADDWTAYNANGSAGTNSLTTAEKYLGLQSLKVTKTNNLGLSYYQQSVNLTKGKTYTFSAYVKTSNISAGNNKGAQLYISYEDSTGTWQKVESGFINGTASWQRMELTFTLPSDSALTRVDVKAALNAETGTAYFDSFQLEDGYIANRYNIVENSDFRTAAGTPSTPDYWSRGADCDSSDYWTSVNDPQHPAMLDNNAFKFTGTAAGRKYIYQYLNLSGTKDDVFTLAGWGKADSAPVSPNKSFCLTVGITRKLNGSVQWETMYFNQDSTDWQYASYKIMPDSDYNKITIFVIYYYNINAAYFDGIQLYKEEFGQTYTHDPDGNIISTTDLAKQETQFKYTNNDMIKMTDPNGSEFKYEYDTKHNINKATSAENVVYSFTYDSYGNPLTSKVGDGTLFIQASSAYTTDGNYIRTLTDASGNTVKYDYDATKGTLNTFTDAKDKITSYTYDANLDRLTDAYKTADGQEVRSTYGYINDRLTQVTHNGFNYNFGYDSLGNFKTSTVGTQNLITNSYDLRSGKLLESTYGNGQKVSSDYDNLDRIIADRYNGNIRYRYEYDAGGNIGYLQDFVNNMSYRYIYDMAERIAKVSDSQGNTTSYSYDPNNNVNNFTENINGSTYSTAYNYDKDNRIKGITYNGTTSNVGYIYDALGRVTNKNVNVSGVNKFSTIFAYTSGANGSSTNKLQSVTNKGNATSYTYDANDNIETITQGSSVIRYYYNELNELIREDNQILNKTITYIYDKGGNFTSKVEYAYTTAPSPTNPTKTYTYAYGDTNWKDKLTNYDGKALTYDAIGNLTNDTVYIYTWVEGRKLATMTKTGQSISFKYGADGIRTEKTVNGLSTKYHMAGGLVTFETDGTDNIYYTYDSAGKLVSMKLNGVEYYYIRNGQGDITGLFDSTGTQVVAYTYDSWGKLISTTGTLASTVGVKNPYRYRGYRYDTETGLYYLQSRYYNPEWGRFISSDTDIGNIYDPGALNLYAYCRNNSATRVDIAGNSDIAARIAFDTYTPEQFAKAGEIMSYQSGVFEIGAVTKYITNRDTADLKSIAVGYLSGKVVSGVSSIVSKGAGKAASTTAKTAGKSGSSVKLNLQLFASDTASAGKRFSPDQQALVELAKDAKRAGGVSRKDANILMDWANEYDLPGSHGPEIHAGRPGPASNVWHVHVGPVGHLPITDY